MATRSKDDIVFTELRAENFKRLRAVRIRPNGAVVQITGENDNGKTSVLDAFAAAVGGKAFCPKVPIRKGESEAEVFVDLGGVRITRRWWFGKTDEKLKSDVVVEYADGTKPKQPQAALDELRGTDIAADPLEFMRLAPKEKYDALRQLVPGFDFDAHDKLRQQKFDDRTDIGRQCDRAKAAADSIAVPQGTPAELVDTAEAVRQLVAATEANTSLSTVRRERERLLQLIEDKRNEADTLYVRAKALEKEADDLEAKLAKVPATALQPVDIAPLQSTIDNAEAINANVRLLLQQDEYRAEHKRLDMAYEAATDEIDALDKKKAGAIAKAKLPVPNLSFGDGEILMNGVPFEDASKANQIKVCTAIAMALKPKLKVILIRDGSLLDEKSMAALGEMVEQNGFVVLLERVSRQGERTGIVIEDGEVA